MTRLPDWEPRLMAALAQTPAFAWNAHDCCRFAARVVRAITGCDRMAGYDGLYASEAEARALIAERGGLRAMVSAELGDPIPVAQAKRGDVVLAELPFCGELLGVAANGRIAAQGTAGLIWLPLRRGLAAWRI